MRINNVLKWLLLASIGLSANLVADTPSESARVVEVPFGDRIDGRILNYNRLTPTIATSGAINEGGVQLLKEEGFQSVLDLRTREEGTAEEAEKVTAAGMSYSNIPLGKASPTAAEIEQFAENIENPERGPLLIHCASANRVGTIWAMYRVHQGIPLEEALLEGRTVGMKVSREALVKAYARSLPSGTPLNL
jgi:uncharacterized protein (TIGR01244 family)